MMTVDTFNKNEFPDEQLTYVIIVSRYEKKKWLFVKHRERQTWELPAGHREPEEKAIEAAKRELYEETGATCYDLFPLFDYSACSPTQEKRYGRVFFAEVEKKGPLPPFEISEVKMFDRMPHRLTYPNIQVKLWDQAQAIIMEKFS